MVYSIITHPKVNPADTQVVAMTGDYKPDSGGFISYCLKPIFEKRRWRGYLACTNFQKSLSAFKRNGKKHVNIFLIDEFVGSGKTAIGRVETIKRQYKEIGVDINVRVKAIAAAAIGVKALNDAGIDFECFYELDRGISDSAGEDVLDKLQLMLAVEELLSKSFEDIDMPSLGYGGTESLYYREDGNAPNSVFPIFRWPIYKNGEDRKTLLTRAMSEY